MKKSKYIMVAIVSALLTCGAIGVNLNTLGVFLVPVSDGLNVGLGDISVHSTLISYGNGTRCSCIHESERAG